MAILRGGFLFWISYAVVFVFSLGETRFIRGNKIQDYTCFQGPHGAKIRVDLRAPWATHIKLLEALKGVAECGKCTNTHLFFFSQVWYPSPSPSCLIRYVFCEPMSFYTFLAAKIGRAINKIMLHIIVSL
ncbi:hypothetical protein B0H34DRAFT_725615 [Crassisporium funariophilum]|nr:hypothetical protein B0H34DRAFT_725615 [Crassisporium funariophilum]